MLLCSLLVLVGGEEEPKLKLATVLFRHGDRSPVVTLPIDRVPVSSHLSLAGCQCIMVTPGSLFPPSLPPSLPPFQEDAWPQGLGQLSVEGMEQHFELGELFRWRYITHTYPSFLTDNYTRVEVRVRSTDYDRTLMSVQAQLAGLYPPKGKWRFHDSLQWQPIPVHTVPTTNDSLLRGHTMDCPRYTELRKEDWEKEEVLALEKEYQGFFKRLQNFTGIEVNLANLWMIENTLFIENASGYGLPDWLKPGEMESLRNLSSYTLSLMFDSPEEVQLTAGSWVRKVRGDIHGKADGEPSLNDSKLFLYSAHDTTMAIMMNALRVWDGKIPAYASAFLIELLSDKDGYFVQMFYRSDTFSSEITPLLVPGCAGGTRCSLEEFERLTDPVLLTEDWQIECGLSSMHMVASTAVGGSSSGGNVTVLGVLLGFFCLLTVGLAVGLVWVYLRKKRLSYSQLKRPLHADEEQ